MTDDLANNSAIDAIKQERVIQEMNRCMERARHILWVLRDINYGDGIYIANYAKSLTASLIATLSPPYQFAGNYTKTQELISEYEKNGNVVLKLPVNILSNSTRSMTS